MTRILLPFLAAAIVVPPLCGQSFTDFTEARTRLGPYASILQLEAGAIASFTDETDRTVGLEDELSWDARAWFRDETFGSRRGTLEAYAGRDGFFGSYTDGQLVGDDTLTRLELRARPWVFYRDGFYRDDQLVPNGFFDGEDYEAYLGFGREAEAGLYIELGPFYRKLDFGRSRLTPAAFTVPDDFNAYGGRIYLEQTTLQLDRRRGLPREGYVLSVCGEREWNDSEDPYGSAGFTTRLPSAVWRVRGRLDWYIPASDQVCWEVFASGGWHDEKDRLQSTDGHRPLGNVWGDAQLRLRLHASQSWSVTPYFAAQYSRLLDEDGFSSSKDFFFGGGIETWLHFSDSLSLHAYWSWIDNENRPSIRIDEDVHGEQMAYVGMVLRFGGARR